MSAPIVEARFLCRWYGQVIALNDVSLEVAGGITALLGPNGAGKSTLLKLLTGEIRPSQGVARVLGEDPWNNPDLFRRVGYCPEQDALYEDMHAAGFVTFLMRLRGYDGRAAASMAEAALADVRLDPGAWGRRVAGFSKGMRQRVRIAQAIAHRPEVLFLDEPLTGLDPMGRRDMRVLFQRLAAGGATLLLSSHVLHEVEATTDRVVLLHHSKLRASGTISEIRDLLDRHPRRVEVVCDRPRELARDLVGLPDVIAVRVPRPDRVDVETEAPDRFYPALVREVVGKGYVVRSLSSPDENLEAVFRYLVRE